MGGKREVREGAWRRIVDIYLILVQRWGKTAQYKRGLGAQNNAGTIGKWTGGGGRKFKRHMFILSHQIGINHNGVILPWSSSE